MWDAAIKAVKDSDENWILENRIAFSGFFDAENLDLRGKLSPGALQAHYREKLWKIYLHSSLGGLELPLAQGGRWLENASLLDANWGWLLGIGVGGAYFADYLSPEMAEKFFSPDDALVAGSGKPDGQAIAESGNYRLSGAWSYCSGCEQASVFTAVTRKEGGISAFVLLREQAEILRDWGAIGLPLTCSHSIVAKNALIPEDHFFDLTKAPRPSGYPLSTYSFMLFAAACFVPVIIGVSRGLWEEVDRFLETKEELWKKYQPERYDHVLRQQKGFGDQLAGLKENFYRLQEESWSAHTKAENIGEEDLISVGQELAVFCYRSCAEIIPKLGMSVLEKEHPLQRQWQHVQTAYQHGVFHSYS